MRDTIALDFGEIKIELKKWLTGRERQVLNSKIFGDRSFSQDEVKTPQAITFRGSDIPTLQNATIEAYVYSVNGETEKVVETLLDLPEDQFNEIYAKITELMNVGENEKKA